MAPKPLRSVSAAVLLAAAASDDDDGCTEWHWAATLFHSTFEHHLNPGFLPEYSTPSTNVYRLRTEAVARTPPFPSRSEQRLRRSRSTRVVIQSASSDKGTDKDKDDIVRAPAGPHGSSHAG
ncbi:hypothetical protein C8Q77DRAFT_863386 [Trametes polyzona]|nr:hypothetical protein C8Q77DRAFT_863386 [Trametes polyzona]